MTMAMAMDCRLGRHRNRNTCLPLTCRKLALLFSRCRMTPGRAACRSSRCGFQTCQSVGESRHRDTWNSCSRLAQGSRGSQDLDSGQTGRESRQGVVNTRQQCHTIDWACCSHHLELGGRGDDDDGYSYFYCTTFFQCLIRGLLGRLGNLFCLQPANNSVISDRSTHQSIKKET